jgi:hypothetical protein
LALLLPKRSATIGKSAAVLRETIPVADVNNETLLIIFVACTGAAVLMQALVLLGMYVTLRKAVKMAEQQIEELRINVLPVVKETKDLLTSVGPKIDSLAGDFAAISRGLRTQGSLIKTSASEIVEKVNRQASRVDMMLTNLLDVFDRTTAVVVDAIQVPVRQVTAIAAFARAAVSNFRSPPVHPQDEPQPTHSPADKDLFV